jgi:hypothetical protein
MESQKCLVGIERGRWGIKGLCSSSSAPGTLSSRLTNTPLNTQVNKMVGNPRAGALATRTRKNAKDLTADEWARFIAALKGIKHKSRPGGVISVYDEFSALHMGAVEIHRTWRRHHPEVKRNDLGNSDPAHDNPGYDFLVYDGPQGSFFCC